MPTSAYSNVSAEYALLSTLAELRAGELSARQCVEAAIARAALVDSDVHAWVVLDADGARSQADALDRLPAGRRGPLHGLPVGVKDIVDVCGLPTRCGSSATADNIATSDAAVVHALREAGAVILGKTVTTEFAYFTPGPTSNPRRLTHTPGGSSSGSAAAVAAGMVPLAIGTQTAASVTRPAAYCGVFAVVVPHGVLATAGIAGLAESLDAPGFLGSDARGLAAVLDAVLPRSLRDTPVRPISKLLVWRPGPQFEVAADMLDAVDRIAERAGDMGLVVEDLDYDATASDLVAAHGRIMAFEAARHSTAATMPRDRLSPALLDLLDTGAAVDNEAYQASLRWVGRIKTELHGLLDDPEAAILAPAAQGAAPRGLAATGNPVMSRPWQALGSATVTFPADTDREGLPLSTQLVGCGDGRALLELAAILSAASDRR